MRISKEEKSKLGIIDYASTKVTINFRLDNVILTELRILSKVLARALRACEISICIYTYEDHLEIVIITAVRQICRSIATTVYSLYKHIPLVPTIHL